MDIGSSRQCGDVESGRALRDQRSFIGNPAICAACEEAAASRARPTDIGSWCQSCMITERVRERCQQYGSRWQRVPVTITTRLSQQDENQTVQ